MQVLAEMFYGTPRCGRWINDNLPFAEFTFSGLLKFEIGLRSPNAVFPNIDERRSVLC
jgi:hypothetical protein